MTSTDVVVLLSTSQAAHRYRCVTHISPRRETSAAVQVRPDAPRIRTWSYTCIAGRRSGRQPLEPRSYSSLVPAVGIVARALNGKPPPNSHSLPAITAEPGALTPRGILARASRC